MAGVSSIGIGFVGVPVSLPALCGLALVTTSSFFSSSVGGFVAAVLNLLDWLAPPFVRQVPCGCPGQWLAEGLVRPRVFLETELVPPVPCVPPPWGLAQLASPLLLSATALL